jgi:hypothetical protein
MLGRLKMSIEECIDAYTSLSDKVFEKQRYRVTVKGKIQGRFDTVALERAVKTDISKAGPRRGCTAQGLSRRSL